MIDGLPLVRDDSNVRRRLRSSVVAFALLMFVASPLAVCAVQAMAASVVQPMAACHEDMSQPAKLDCCAGSTEGLPQVLTAKTELVQRNAFHAVLLEHPALGQQLIPSIDATTRSLAPPQTGPPDCVRFAVLLI